MPSRRYHRLLLSLTLLLSLVTAAYPASGAELSATNVTNGTLNAQALTGPVTITVQVPGMKKGDKLYTVFTGIATHSTVERTLKNSDPVTFNFPKANWLENINRTVSVNYYYSTGTVVRRPGATPLTIQVRGEQVSPVFRVVEATNNRLDPATLDGPITVEVYYPTMRAGDTVQLVWSGAAVFSPVLKTVNQPTLLTFKIPKAQVTRSNGQYAQLTYIYQPAGSTTSVTSSVLQLAVGNARPIDADYAAILNARYRDTAPSCADNKPAYYCNGIVIRSTENGAFDPWDPSPAATRLGGVSFSYMRLDAHVSSLYHNSGFILKPQANVEAPQVAPQYLCIYAYDAGTLVGARGDKGCALKARSLGSCTSQNVSTPAQWYAYTQTLANRDYQCSLSTDDPVQFQTSITVRANRPANMEALWNEMMIADWGQGKGATLPMEAIFYKTGYKEEARVFQEKLKTRNNVWLPIVKLDLTQLSGSPFSYSAADQAVLP
ncbi:hypothetical protein [Pseudomonas sp.]|uniref:hypothetical protein n=1 Tax=Pseudomonas sp. TaxID=306 RepID=UPI00258D1F5A|nr:hypothetical protein [Pseudomonas sp.]